MILWMNHFLSTQVYSTDNTVLFRDNQSTILLEVNGSTSSSKRMKHINCWYYFITNHVNAGDFRIKYCPTECIVADFFTKPLQGTLFCEFCCIIMNPPNKEEVHIQMLQECVGGTDKQAPLMATRHLNDSYSDVNHPNKKGPTSLINKIPIGPGHTNDHNDPSAG